MKTKLYLILIAAVMSLCCCCNALGESSTEAVLTRGEDWSWSRGAYNTFSGQIDLSGCPADELTICMTADLPYNEETEQNSPPVFTSVNGKRIVMAKQSDTVKITKGSEENMLDFSASFRLPEKQHIKSVPLSFCITDADGNILKTASCRIESGDEGSGEAGSPCYIPVDINVITLILLAVAALIWLLILIRSLKMKKKQRMGE